MRGGGVLVVTMRSGVKDVYNTVVNQRLPGLLAELCGVEVEEYDSLAPGMQNGIEFTIPELAVSHPPTVKVWCDVLKPTTAAIIGRYTSDYYMGRPAITLNQYVQGKVLYVGTMGDDALYELLTRWLLNLAGVRRTWSVPPGVEAAERWQGDRRLLFVLNHTEHEQEITLGEAYVSLVDSKESLGGTIPIAPHEVLVLMEKEHVE